MEVYIAERMAAMIVGDFCSPQMTMRHSPREAEAMELIAKFEAASQIALNERQKAAAQVAVTAPLASITGGAGVGKTTVVAAVCGLSEALGAQVYLLALSGRAARRSRKLRVNRPRRSHHGSALWILDWCPWIPSQPSSVCLAKDDNLKALSQRIDKLFAEGKYQDAIPIAERAIEVAKRARGPEQPVTAEALNNLAILFFKIGIRDSRTAFAGSAPDPAEGLGPEHPDTGHEPY